MSPARIIRTAPAKADLVAIWNHVADHSPAAADRLLRQIDSQIVRLAEFPEIGPRRPEIAEDLRTLTVGSYVVMYRHIDGVVAIIRVVHGARDLPELF